MLFVCKTSGCSKIIHRKLIKKKKHFIPLFLLVLIALFFIWNILWKTPFKSDGVDSTKRSSSILEEEPNPNQNLGSILLNEFNYLL